MASRYKKAEPLTSKDSSEVAKAFANIYKRSPLVWPEMLQVDPGREFMGTVTKEMEKHDVFIRRGRPEIYRDQGIVERFNRTLAERLFGHQYGVQILKDSFDNAGKPTQRSTAWVARLPEVVAAINNEKTSFTGKKPADAIKEKSVAARPSISYKRLVGDREKNLPIGNNGVRVRYLYFPGELEGGGKRRATDPIWSLKVYTIERSFTKFQQPVLYYLYDGPTRGFVREELMVIPSNT